MPNDYSQDIKITQQVEADTKQAEKDIDAFYAKWLKKAKQNVKNFKALNDKASKMSGGDPKRYDEILNNLYLQEFRKQQRTKLSRLEAGNKNIKERPSTIKKRIANIDEALEISKQKITGTYSLKAQSTQQEQDRLKKIGAEIRGILGDSSLYEDEVLRNTIAQQEDDLKGLIKEYTELREKGKDVSEVTEKIKAQNKELQKTKKELQNLNKKNWFQTLISTFKRIGFYRLARDFFRLTINAFKQGIQLFATVDKVANETMSDLTSSLDVIKVSMSAMLLSIVQMLTPAIRDIGTAFAEVANNISQAVAKMRGLSTYTKINAEYMKEYGKETKNALLSFDKFESLNNQNDSSGLLIPDQEIDETSEAVKAWEGTLKTIKSIFSFVWDIIKNIGEQLKLMWEQSIEPNLGDIMNFVNQVVNFIGYIISGLVRVATWIGKNTSLFRTLVILVAGVATLIGAMTGNIGLVIKAGAITAIAAMYDPSSSVSHSNASTSLSQPSSSETVGQGITDSVASAITQTSDLKDYNPTVVLNLDGAEVARSKRFNDEMNRRTSGLNLV